MDWVVGKRPHHNVAWDRVARGHFFPVPSTMAAAARFERFRRGVFCRELGTPDAPSMRLASLVGCEIIIDATKLELAYAALDDVRRWDGRPCIDWQQPGAPVERRLLSPMTTAVALSAPGVPFEVAKASLRTALVAAGIYDAHGGQRDVLETLLEDAGAWAIAYLPGYLFAHVLGSVQLASLPRTCLARGTQLRPLSPVEGIDAAETVPRELAAMLRRTVATSPAHSEAAELKELVLSRIVRTPGTPEYVNRRRSIQLLSLLLQGEIHGSVHWALIVGFALYLLGTGTVRTSTPSLGTVAEYWALLAEPLLTVLPQLLAGSGDPEVRRAGYTRVIEAVDPGSRHKASAALSAFHLYIADYCDAPEMIGAVGRGLFEEPTPRANVLWPHEIDAVRRRLPANSQDRIVRQARVLFELLVATGGRCSEMLSPFLGALRFDEPGRVRLVVDPLPSHGRLKTPAARREVPITDPTAAAVLASWHRCRIEEGAGPRDLLFGDPHAPRHVYREMATRAVLLAELRAVTGDAEVTLHSLRHTRATHDISSVAEGPDEEREVEQIAARLGHESASATYRHYYHFPEVDLRRELDRLEGQIPLPEAVASQWLGVPKGTLRKRWLRARVAPAEYVWGELRRQRRAASFPDISSGIPLAASCDCAQAPEIAARPTYRSVANALRDATAGHSIRAIVRRTGETPDIVRRVLVTAAEIAGRHLSARELDGPTDLVFGAIWRECSFRPDAAATMQTKYAALVDHLDAVEADDELTRAVRSWSECLKGRYVSLETPTRAVPLLALLRRARLGPGRLVVRLAPRATDSGDAAAELEAAVTERFRGVFGSVPRIERRSGRRGRPRAYLLVCGSAHGAEAKSASLAMGGFHFLLLAAAVLVRMAAHAETVQ